VTERQTLILVGNANVGKSVVFGYLTGTYVIVSNYPGTTVEIARGNVSHAGTGVITHRLQVVNGGEDDIAQPDGADIYLQRAGVNARDVEQAVDHLEQLLAFFQDHAQVLLDVRGRLGARAAVGEQLGVAHDRGERRFQLVADRGEKVRFHAAELGQLPIGEAQALVFFFQLAVGLTDRGEVHGRGQRGLVGAKDRQLEQAADLAGDGQRALLGQGAQLLAGAGELGFGLRRLVARRAEGADDQRAYASPAVWDDIQLKTAHFLEAFTHEKS